MVDHAELNYDVGSKNYLDVLLRLELHIMRNEYFCQIRSQKYAIGGGAVSEINAFKTWHRISSFKT